MPHARSPSRLIAGAVSFGLIALAPAASHAAGGAGEYTVYSCTGSGGAPNTAAGWTAKSGGGAATGNMCLQGMGLQAALAGPTPAAASAASWTFTAPAGTSITDVAAQRHTIDVVPGIDADQHGAPSYFLYLDNTALDSCVESNTSQCQANLMAPIIHQGLAGSQLSFVVQCGSSSVGPVCQNPVGAVFTQLAIGLRDPVPPKVTALSVLDNGARSGTLKLGYSATDQGGGVYRTVVKADGTVVSATPVAPGTSCVPANPADNNPFEFIVPVPCPLSVSNIPVTVPVAGLPPGPHSLEIDVEDAAGNDTVAYGPVPFPAENPATEGVSPAALKALQLAKLKVWFVASHTRRFRHSYGTRVVTRGVLTDPQGHGIVGARVTVYHIIHGGRRRLLKTGLKTRGGGRLTLILPDNLTTRNIEYDYQALIPGPVTSRQTLHLTVELRRR